MSRQYCWLTAWPRASPRCRDRAAASPVPEPGRLAVPSQASPSNSRRSDRPPSADQARRPPQLAVRPHRAPGRVPKPGSASPHSRHLPDGRMPVRSGRAVVYRGAVGPVQPQRGRRAGVARGSGRHRHRAGAVEDAVLVQLVASPPSSGRTTFSAIGRPAGVNARYTLPMPPEPSRARSRYPAISTGSSPASGSTAPHNRPTRRILHLNRICGLPCSAGLPE
jgi:hypothetical protein